MGIKLSLKHFVDRKMYKRFILLLCAASMALLSPAGARSEAQLRTRAGEVLHVKSSKNLRHVASCRGLEVYGRTDGGFAIMAGDDRLPSLLAYSPDGHFSPDSDNHHVSSGGHPQSQQ